MGNHENRVLWLSDEMMSLFRLSSRDFQGQLSLSLFFWSLNECVSVFSNIPERERYSFHKSFCPRDRERKVSLTLLPSFLWNRMCDRHQWVIQRHSSPAGQKVWISFSPDVQSSWQYCAFTTTETTQEKEEDWKDENDKKEEEGERRDSSLAASAFPSKHDTREGPVGVTYASTESMNE